MDYVAEALSPEYFLVMGAEGTAHDEAELRGDVGVGSDRRAARREPGMANDAVVRLHNPSDRRPLRSEVEADLQQRLPGVAATVTALDEERVYG